MTPAKMQSFDFQLRTRIVFGPDRLSELGALTSTLGACRALLVSDPGITSVGHTGRAVDSLVQADIATRVFQDVHENPTTDDVDAGVVVARQCRPQVIIGLGGGSALDCAKGINFLLTNGGRMQDYHGLGQAVKPLLPMIGIPTTAGTGSEAQSFALISDPHTHLKMACGDRQAAFRIALLDPRLTLTQPRRVTALTGIDAIAHAVETYVSKTRNPVSLGLSREAWRLLAVNFPRVLDTPDDLSARAGMQLGACLAGLAIENSMLGAAHALANPLTAEYGLAHGQAVALVLPHVVRYNASQAQAADAYAELIRIPGHHRDPTPNADAPERLASRLEEMVTHTGLPNHLSACGVKQECLPALAEAAAQQWTGTFNPRDVGPDELLAIYREAF